jgi:hypothetical protein
MHTKSFNDCMVIHLLTAFPNNAAEQERYYITNMLKKPQRISVCQFVQRVEQLNSHITQLPCWFYSPSAKPSMISMNLPFTKADLVSHLLWVCPLTWQDHFNLHEKDMIPADISLLLMSLEATERICIQERSNAQSKEKASNMSKKGTK